MGSRPELTRSLDSRTFREYYYLKEELAAFCRSNHLPASGGKQELTERIACFLENGEVRQPAAKRMTAHKKANSGITRESIIEEGFACTETHRAFFREEIGNSFSFNVRFQQWLKANAGKTYADAITAYHEIREAKKAGKSAIGKQFEYNTYIRDFFADNPGRTLEDAIRCWKYKKSLKGHNRYERSDLAATEPRTRRLAVISDIHGNLPALNAILEDAKSRGISEFAFAGDYCLSGPFPDECIATLTSLEHTHIVRGNEEKYLENLIGKDQRDWTDGQMQVTYWAFRNIQPERLQFLTALPHTLEFQVNGVKIHLSHHSSIWTGDCEFRLIGPDVLAKRYEGMDVTPEGYRQDVHRLFRQDPGFQSALSVLEEGVYLFGHSHVQWNWQDADRKVFLVNPGSCGLPLDFIHGSVPYTVLSVSEGGTVSIEEVRVPFDKQGYAEVLRNSEQFREANVWTKVIMKEWLKTHEHMTFFLEFAEQYAQEIGDTGRPFSVETWENAYEIWNRTMAQSDPQTGGKNR